MNINYKKNSNIRWIKIVCRDKEIRIIKYSDLIILIYYIEISKLKICLLYNLKNMNKNSLELVILISLFK
jgi:hypothetical protein